MEIVEPYTYLASNPGKNLRSGLIRAFAAVLKSDPDLVDIVDACISKLHVASMLIDDVEDSSTTRRGRPAAHLVYGPALTINCSHYVVFEAMRDLADPELQEIFLDEILALHRGQGQDIYWRDKHICPTETQYIKMVRNKTGGLLRMAVRMLWSKSRVVPLDTLVSLADHLGVLYQIQDDLLNLMSYEAQKGFCEDLTEGKYSFPVIHCLQTAPPAVADEMHKILISRPTEKDVKMRALELLKSSKSLSHTRTQVWRWHGATLDLASELEDSQLKLAVDRMVLLPRQERPQPLEPL